MVGLFVFMGIVNLFGIVGGFCSITPNSIVGYLIAAMCFISAIVFFATAEHINVVNQRLENLEIKCGIDYKKIEEEKRG